MLTRKKLLILQEEDTILICFDAYVRLTLVPFIYVKLPINVLL